MSVLALIGFMNLYTLRVNLSVAIVAMTSPQQSLLENGTVIQVPAEFDWDSRIQGLVLSSFFYGYTAGQFPGGWMASRIGGSRLIGMGIASAAVLTLLTPLTAQISVYLFVAIRIAIGFLQGIALPAMHQMWSRWAPPLERARMVTLVTSGLYVGNVAALPISGMLDSYIGWPSVFYVFGALALLWYALWWALIADSPDKDPRISSYELKYITESLGAHVQDMKVIYHPWRKIFTCVPYLAEMVAHFANNWGLYTMVTQLPTFMKDTLKFNVEEAGFVSALPYLGMVIVLQFAGHAADYLQRRRILSLTNIRKLFLCCALALQATSLLVSTYLTNVTAVIVCLIIGVALGGFVTTTLNVLVGMSICSANFSGIISPQLTGFIVRNKSANEWRIVFYITSGWYFLGALVYALFGSAEKQPWAEMGTVKLEPKATKTKVGAESQELRNIV